MVFPGTQALRCIAAGAAGGLAALAGVAQAWAGAPDHLSGARLFADVQRYAAFGEHRLGTEADRQTTTWLRDELARAGFSAEFQAFGLARQYEATSVAVKIGLMPVSALPFWWPPAGQPSFQVRAPLAADGDAPAPGQVVWVDLPRLPIEQTAYLGAREKAAIAAAVRRAPAAILVSFETPSGQPYAFNVDQTDEPWPVPVVTLGSAQAAALRAAQGDGRLIDIAVQGRHLQQVEGRNVIARLDRRAARTVVVSTPTTGWFACACERGTGIAAFLALARTVAASTLDANFVFVATAGHEIGHGGMGLFLQDQAPAPQSTEAWLHIGASLACYGWRQQAGQWVAETTVDPKRALLFSPALEAAVGLGFAGIEPLQRAKVEGRRPPGELRDIHAAGYPRFFGMVGAHHFFHNPGDTPEATGPEILEPVARALWRTLAQIISAR